MYAVSTPVSYTHLDVYKRQVHKEVIPLDEEDKVCPVCGSPMERIGEEYVRKMCIRDRCRTCEEICGCGIR